MLMRDSQPVWDLPAAEFIHVAQKQPWCELPLTLPTSLLVEDVVELKSLGSIC